MSSIVFRPFSISNNSDLSGIFGIVTDNVSVSIRNSYVNNGTGIVNLSNNSKGYTVECNSYYDEVKELVVLKNNDTMTGDITNIKNVTVTESSSDPNCVGSYTATSTTSVWTRTVGTVVYTATYDTSAKTWSVSRSAGIIDSVSYEAATISDVKVTGNTENVYNIQSLENYGVNCVLSGNCSFSTDDVMHNIYQEVITDEYGSLYNFPNFDNTIPLINILNSNNSLLLSYFEKDQLYSDYKTGITYNYGTIVYYSEMYFKCINNNVKDVTPGTGMTASLNAWGAYSVAKDEIIEYWDSNEEYSIGDVVNYIYKFYKCLKGNYANKPLVDELNVESEYWEECNLDKSVLLYKYADFANVIITPDWGSSINYQYGDVVKNGSKYYNCVSSIGVTTTGISIDNEMYWAVDNRFDEKFNNVYRRFDNIFVNDGNVSKFTNKSFLTKDDVFEVRNLLDIEILQNYLPRNLNGYTLTIKFYGQDLNNYINNNTIHHNSAGYNYYYISVNDRSMFDPTYFDMLQTPLKDGLYESDKYPLAAGSISATPLVRSTDISTFLTSRPVTAKINISGFYGGTVKIIFENWSNKKIIRRLNSVSDSSNYMTYTNGVNTVNNSGEIYQYYVDTIPCSFVFKDIYGKLVIGDESSTRSTAANIILNTVKSDGYIFKFVNCENVEINPLNLYMSYPNKFGGLTVENTKMVTPNDCYESFLVFNNCKAVVKQCYYNFLFYIYNNHSTYCYKTFQRIWTSDGEGINQYVFNHDFAGLKREANSSVDDGNTISSYAYIVEGLITCENNSQCLIENDQDVDTFTNTKINSNTNYSSYVTVLTNSQVTWLPIGIYEVVKIRETMVQYLENHLENDSVKRYQNTSLSVISDEFFNRNADATTGMYEESLSRKVLKASIWKRILNKFQNISGSDDTTLPLTTQMLYVFLQLWKDESEIEVSPSGLETASNYFYNVSGTTINDSSTFSTIIKEGNWDLSKGKFKAAKILIDLLKTVEQSLNFDVVSDDDKSATSYDTTEKTGTAVEYKKVEESVDTTILDSFKTLISLLTLHTTTDTGNADDRLNKYFLNACGYEDNLDIKPQSIINGALVTFETVLTSVCENLGVTCPTYDLSNITQVNESSDDRVTYSDLTINFIGTKKDLDTFGYKIVSNFNNNIFYPNDNVSFYDQVYVPEENTTITDFSYTQTWTLGVTLLGDSRGSSIVSPGGIWEDNTTIEMEYEKLDSTTTTLITDDTQCVIKLHFIAPKMLFSWMEFFDSIESLNWTCKTFMGVVGSLLSLFGSGRSSDGLWQLFDSGYSHAYNSLVNASGLANNPCYILWYYLYNPSSETGYQATTLKAAEQLYIIDELLSATASTVSGILNHYHLYPSVTSQSSGIPVGSIGITWRSYISNNLVTNAWSYPGTFLAAKAAGTLLYDKLGSCWAYCDGTPISSSYKSSSLTSIYGTNAPYLPCLNHTYYQPYISGSIGGSAQRCGGEGWGWSTVTASATYDASNGPYLFFQHSSSRATGGSSCHATINYGWNTSKWHSGDDSRYAGTATSSFAPLFNQMGYKLVCSVNGTDTVLSNGVNTCNFSNGGSGKGMSYYLSNFKVVDGSNQTISVFRYNSCSSNGYGTNTQYGGEYSAIPATATVSASCSGTMYVIATEVVYIMKISSSSSAQTALSGLLKGSGYKPKFKTAYQILKEKNKVSEYITPNIYYDDNGLVYNISFGNNYDNTNGYNISSMSEKDFKSNNWIFNGIIVDQMVNNESLAYTLYRYKDNQLYVSNNNLKKYIQMVLTDTDQRMAALFNSNEDHKFGYTIKIGKKQYYNVPVDMMINSTGVGSNDLTLLQFKNNEDQYYMPNDLLEFNTVDFGNNDQFTNVSMSKFNYSKLIDTNLKQFVYYQYIELDHLTEDGLRKIREIFGDDLTIANIDKFDEDIELDLNYTTGSHMTFCMYKTNTRVSCSAANRVTNNVGYICIVTTINDITEKELKTFTDSIEDQRKEKYTNRNLGSAADIYNQYVEKYQLDKEEDFSVGRVVFTKIIEEIGKVRDEI